MPGTGQEMSTSVPSRNPVVSDSTPSANLNITEATAPTTAISPRIKGNAGTIQSDVAFREREEKRLSVRQKNDDIFKVIINCGEIVTDYGDYSDDFDVAGSLCRPTSVEFFKQLGASDYILKSLSEGHHSKFKSEVPRYEKRNNNSFYEHKQFAQKGE